MRKETMLIVLAWLLQPLMNNHGFAKVTGPLFSISASGKLADAMVHFPWKGRSVVRKWLKPSNPQTTAQGDRRVMLGGLGRGASVVNTASQFAVYTRVVTPAGQTWVSYFVKYMMETYFTSAANFTTHDSEEGAHTAHVDFAEEAQDLAIAHYNLAYKGMATQFTQAHILYCLAKFSSDMYLADPTKFNESPYDTALASWSLTEIQEMVAHFAAL